MKNALLAICCLILFGCADPTSQNKDEANQPAILKEANKIFQISYYSFDGKLIKSWEGPLDYNFERYWDAGGFYDSKIDGKLLRIIYTKFNIVVIEEK